MDYSPPGSSQEYFPGKNTGTGCHFLLQGIFPTPALNPRLLHWQVPSLPLSHQGIPWSNYTAQQFRPEVMPTRNKNVSTRVFMATLLTVAKQWTRPRRQVTGIAIKEMWPRDFFGSPVVRTPHFHCRGRGFQSLVGELRSCEFHHMAKEKRKKCSLSVQGNITCVRAQSYPTLCDPLDCSLPGPSGHGILQAGILELVAISFSRGSS